MSKGFVGKPLCVSWLFETLKVKRVALRSGRTATFVKGVEPHKAGRWIRDVGMMFHDLASNLTPFQPSSIRPRCTERTVALHHGL